MRHANYTCIFEGEKEKDEDEDENKDKKEEGEQREKENITKNLWCHCLMKHEKKHTLLFVLHKCIRKGRTVSKQTRKQNAKWLPNQREEEERGRECIVKSKLYSRSKRVPAGYCCHIYYKKKLCNTVEIVKNILLIQLGLKSTCMHKSCACFIIRDLLEWYTMSGKGKK